MLVTQFVLGLKDELRAVVEIQIPESVSRVAIYANVQGGVFDRTKNVGYKGGSGKQYK